MDIRQILKAALLAACLSLTACGGGGGDGGADPGGDDPGGGGSGGGDPVADITPEAFALQDIEEAEPDTYYTASMTVAGVDVPVKARASKGSEFSVDGGTTWRTDAADVENGDEVMIRLKSKAVASGMIDAHLFVGGVTQAPDAEGTVSDNFQVVTKSDFEKPEVSVHFPPPNSLTDVPLPATIVLRGMASDDQALARVLVNDQEADIDAAGNWSMEYDVQAGDNLITVAAIDTVGKETTQNIMLKHVADRDGLDFGTGNVFSNPQSAFWDAGRQRLVVGDTFRLVHVDLETADRTSFTVSGVGGRGIDHDTVNDRYVAGRFSGGNASLWEVDPVTGAHVEISARGDGKGDDTDFRIPEDIAVAPDGKRIFARIDDDGNTATFLWEINGDSSSADFGAREKFSDEALANQKPGLAIDPARDRLLIGNCSLREIALSDPAGTYSSEVIAQAADFCVHELAVAGDTAWGRSRVGGGDFIVKMDLVEATYETVSDLADTGFGPVPHSSAYEPPPGIDAERGIYYLYHEGEAVEADAVFAIDLENGYRVIVSQED